MKLFDLLVESFVADASHNITKICNLKEGDRFQFVKFAGRDPISQKPRFTLSGSNPPKTYTVLDTPINKNGNCIVKTNLERWHGHPNELVLLVTTTVSEQKINKSHIAAMPGVTVHSGLSYYDQYRLGMAMAGTPDSKESFDTQGPFGPKLVTIGYTETESDIVDKALKRAGLNKGKKRVTPKGSSEHKQVNKTSPVAKKPKFKIQESYEDALPTTYVFKDLQNQDPYKQYRFGIAMAAARAAEKYGVKYNPSAKFGENLIVVARSAAEEETVKLAQKIYGPGSQSEMISDSKSTEETNTNTVSPYIKK